MKLIKFQLYNSEISNNYKFYCVHDISLAMNMK